MGRTSMTRQIFDEKVAALKKGERLIYHVGSVMFDSRFGPEFMKVFNVASAAWEAMEKGMVHLVQRMIMPGCYEYIAIKRAEPFEPVVWLGCYGKRHD